MTAERAVGTTSAASADVPYAPSWVDLITRAIDWLPIPAWATYLLLVAALGLFLNAIDWIGGIATPGTFDPIQLAYPGLGAYMLALMHYLNREAGTRMDAFRPALEVDAREFERLRYILTSLPTLPAALVGLAGFALISVLFLTDPGGAVSGLHPAVLVGRLAVLGFVFALGAALIYHTIRQLRLVSRIHALATRIDLFEPTPLYAFSNLTAQTGIGFVAIVAVSFVIEPSINVVGIASNSVALAIAAAAFVLPLRGMHGRIAAEKDRLHLETNRRLKATVAELHQSIDKREFSVAEGLYHTLASLQLERDALARISTWPWQTGTLRAFVSVLLVPIVIWLIIRGLERFV
jgi:hypothetical protein